MSESIASMSRPYVEIVDALVQVAVKYEMARRGPEHALAECKRVRERLPPGVPVNPRQASELEVAMAAERKARTDEANALEAYKRAALVLTKTLEERAAAVSSVVPM